MQVPNLWFKSLSKILIQYRYLGLALLGFGLNIFTSSYALAACTPGVLVTCAPQGGFVEYANEVLAKNNTYFYYAALVMVVFSGVQYMTSGFSPEASKQAKGRIVGIIGGLIFFILMENILRLISSSFTF